MTAATTLSISGVRCSSFLGSLDSRKLLSIPFRHMSLEIKKYQDLKTVDPKQTAGVTYCIKVRLEDRECLTGLVIELG